MVRVLLTGVGAPGTAGTLWALRRNPDGEEVEVTGTDVDPGAAGRRLVDRFAVVRSAAADPAGYLADLARLARGVDVVLPQNTAELALLAARPPASIRAAVAVGSAASLARLLDKRRLILMASRAGVPVPDTFLIRRPAAIAVTLAVLGYPARPAIVKPVGGNGSRGVRLLADAPPTVAAFLADKPGPVPRVTRGEFERMFAADASAPFPPLLAQEYLPGAEWTVDAFRDPGPAGASLAVARRRDRIVAGISFVSSVPPAADADGREAERMALAVGAAAGYRGVYGIQVRADADGQLKLLECNPRVQGTMVATAFAGANLPWAAVCRALGRPVRLPARAALRALRFSRLWGGVADDGTCHETL